MVKISRAIDNHKESFWVGNVRTLDGRLFGDVSNELLLDHAFDLGDTIEITEDEIIEDEEEIL